MNRGRRLNASGSFSYSYRVNGLTYSINNLIQCINVGFFSYYIVGVKKCQELSTEMQMLV